MTFDLKTTLILCVVGGFVLSGMFTLIGLLRGDKNVRAEASKWGLAVGGGRQAQADNAAQAAALHNAVEALKHAPTLPEPPTHE